MITATHGDRNAVGLPGRIVKNPELAPCSGAQPLRPTNKALPLRVSTAADGIGGKPWLMNSSMLLPWRGLPGAITKFWITKQGKRRETRIACWHNVMHYVESVVAGSNWRSGCI